METPKANDYQNYEFDARSFKMSFTESDIPSKSTHDKNAERDNDGFLRSPVYANIPYKNKFSETNEFENLQREVSINNFPPSLISIKRAGSPLMNSMNSCREMIDSMSHLKTENLLFEGADRQCANVLNTVTCNDNEDDPDKTSLFISEFAESNFSTNFKKALENHKSYVCSPSRLSKQKYNKEKKSLSSLLSAQSQEFSPQLSSCLPSAEKVITKGLRIKNSSFVPNTVIPIQVKQPSPNRAKYRSSNTIPGHKNRTESFSLKSGPEKSYKDLSINTLQINKIEIPPYTSLNSARTDLSSQRAKIMTPIANKEGSGYPKTLLKSLFQFNFYKRTKCTCDSNLKEDETCSTAMRWILKKYKKSEFEYLKATYQKILSETKLQDVNQQRQIQKDITRTYPTNKFFASNSEGYKIF